MSVASPLSALEDTVRKILMYLQSKCDFQFIISTVSFTFCSRMSSVVIENEANLAIGAKRRKPIKTNKVTQIQVCL